MNPLKTCWFILLTLSLNTVAFALDADSQAVIDAYKTPFDLYFKAITDMGNTLKQAKNATDLTKVVDQFCDEANSFVDQYNEVQSRYKDSSVLQAMNDKPDATKAVKDLMNDVQKKFQTNKPIFDSLLKQLTKYPSSASIKRAKDRLYWTIQRVQGISPY
jgi:hypothetical protein